MSLSDTGIELSNFSSPSVQSDIPSSMASSVEAFSTVPSEPGLSMPKKYGSPLSGHMSKASLGADLEPDLDPTTDPADDARLAAQDYQQQHATAGSGSRGRTLLHQSVATIRFYFTQTARHVTRNPGSAFLALLAVTIAVLAVGVALTALEVAPVLFLGMAESKAAEIDLLLTPAQLGGDIDFLALNFTLLDQELARDNLADAPAHGAEAAVSVSPDGLEQLASGQFSGAWQWRARTGRKNIRVNINSLGTCLVQSDVSAIGGAGGSSNSNSSSNNSNSNSNSGGAGARMLADPGPASDFESPIPDGEAPPAVESFVDGQAGWAPPLTPIDRHSRMNFSTWTRALGRWTGITPAPASPRRMEPFRIAEYIPPDSQQQQNLCIEDARQCRELLCPPSMTGSILLVDAKRERAMGLGRGWTNTLERGTCVIHREVARTVGLQAGDHLLVTFHVDSKATLLPYFHAIGLNITETDEESGSLAMPLNTVTVSLPLRVSEVVSSSKGKWPSRNRDVIIMDIHNFLPLASSGIEPDAKFTEQVLADLAALDPLVAVDSVLFAIPPVGEESLRLSQLEGYYDPALGQTSPALLDRPGLQRHEAYIRSNFDTSAREVTRWASRIATRLGLTQFENQLPVLVEYEETAYATAFLSLALNIIIILLAAVSALLVDALLIAAAEARASDWAKLRVLGLRRTPHVAALVLIHALGAVGIPATVIGLCLAQALHSGVVRSVLGSFVPGVTIVRGLTPVAVGVGLGVGLGVPLIVAILPGGPVATANAPRLHDALYASSRPQTQAVEITVSRSNPDRARSALLITGALLGGFGALVYYALPLALISGNLGLLFDIFFIILAGLILGCVLIALNAQPLVERGLVSAMLFVARFIGESAATAGLVRSNLISHRKRNRKSALIYATSLSFVVFLAVAADIELRSMEYETIRWFGSDIRIDSRNIDRGGPTSGIREVEKIEAWCHDNRDLIAGCGWISTSTSNALVDSSWESNRPTRLQTVGRAIREDHYVYGVTPDLFSAFPGNMYVESPTTLNMRRSMRMATTAEMAAAAAQWGAVSSTAEQQRALSQAKMAHTPELLLSGAGRGRLVMGSYARQAYGLEPTAIRAVEHVARIWDTIPISRNSSAILVDETDGPYKPARRQLSIFHRVRPMVGVLTSPMFTGMSSSTDGYRHSVTSLPNQLRLLSGSIRSVSQTWGEWDEAFVQGPSAFGLPHRLDWSERVYETVSDLPLRTFLAKLRPNVTEAQLEYLIAAAPTDSQHVVRDVRDEIPSLAGNAPLLTFLFQGVTIIVLVVAFFALYTAMAANVATQRSFLFQGVTIIVLVVAFFALYTAMAANVATQRSEIGAMRAIGAGRWFVWRVYAYEAFVLVVASAILGSIVGLLIGWHPAGFPLPLVVWRVYAYEAFVLVVASAILGSIVGLLIGWSISAQRALLTGIPLAFLFPWTLVLTVGAGAALSALLATAVPVAHLVAGGNGTVVRIMRGGTSD
ncbi:hypothetical protein H696_03056 [Fonticula alba]|uniref:ABC3 transporter permease C-terminal domain-containing protein n=1 Tax=Fonticula alba TaxID=691883 RepID=A0A058Z9U2_FONAL|nr:hypothetical protein H696_03056 [Fonticula alba]KCV70703.1 hypothetical protein H696_03056 [Fonticula alba]|eukprot:XP_009495219.1 hypothetical protein H696_03056 [Fonticula alba]